MSNVAAKVKKKWHFSEKGYSSQAIESPAFDMQIFTATRKLPG
jgi:hypothetical protein